MSLSRKGLIIISLVLVAGAGTAYAGIVLPTITLGGNVVVEGDLDMTNGKISNLAAPSVPSDAATKSYVDANSGVSEQSCNQGDIVTGFDINGDPICKTLKVVQNEVNTIDFEGGVGRWPSLELVNKNIPVISYRDDTNNALKFVRCSYVSCGNDNHIETLDTGGGAFSSLALAFDDIPVISYHSAIGTSLKLVRCGDEFCSSGNTIRTVDDGGISGQVGRYTSIKIISFDSRTPVISYQDQLNGDLKFVRCGDETCSTGNTINVVDSSGNTGRETSLALASGDIPVIAYTGGNFPGELRLVRCGDTTCDPNSGNNIQVVDTNVPFLPSLALATGDIPVIAYRAGSSPQEELRLVRCGDTTCSSGNIFQTIETFPSIAAGGLPSIALTSDDFPVISYKGGSRELKIVKCGNTTCSSGNVFFTADTDAQLGFSSPTSLELSDDGNPVVAYAEIINNDLRLFRQFFSDIILP